MYFTNCFPFSHSITEANTRSQCLPLPVKLQKSINQVTWGDITGQSCRTFLEILINKLKTIAKKLYFPSSFFFNFIPFQCYYSPTLHHGRAIIYYLFFPNVKNIFGRVKNKDIMRNNKTENDPQFCIFPVCILWLTPFLLALFISKIACDCSITAAYSIYLV